jgi:hypothetical protein
MSKPAFHPVAFVLVSAFLFSTYGPLRAHNQRAGTVASAPATPAVSVEIRNPSFFGATVLSVTFDPQDIPSRVPYVKKPDEIYVKVIVKADVNVRLLPKRRLDVSVYKLRVGSQLRSLAFEHVGNAWGQLARGWEEGVDRADDEAELYFAVPRNTRLNDIRLVIQ